MSDVWRIRGGRVIDPASNRDETADVWIGGDRFVAPPREAASSSVRVIDAQGCVVVPGFIDLHVHLREPGGEAAETVESGARAAARGGFTAVVAMPNTTPPADCPAAISALLTRSRSCGIVVLPSGCITKGRAGAELADLEGMRRAGAAAFTDDGSTVVDDGLMRLAMQRARALGVPIMDHALDPRLAGKGALHEGEFSARHGVPGIPARAESAIVERDIRLCEETGCSVHIQHVSARESVLLIRSARRRGLPVSGEATPHHIALIDADVDIRNANFKMNPPLRSAADREAIIEAVADGTLQALATDHAPHTLEAKRRDFCAAPFGVVGLETAVGVTYTRLVQSGLMSLRAWVERWTTGPAMILGRQPPSLAPGAPADLAILDLESTWTVRAEEFLSRSRNTPFEGLTLTGRATCTFCNGTLVWREQAERERT